MKRISRFISVFLVAVMLLPVSLLLPGCSSATPLVESEVRAYADSIVENLLQGLGKADYAQFSRDFNQQMKTGIPESNFSQFADLIKKNLGDYQSKTFSGAQRQEQYVVTVYNARYALETENVVVTVSFEESGGKNLVAGFFMNSPKLRNPQQ